MLFNGMHCESGKCGCRLIAGVVDWQMYDEPCLYITNMRNMSQLNPYVTYYPECLALVVTTSPEWGDIPITYR